MAARAQVTETIELQDRLARADEDIESGRVYCGDEAKNRVRELAKERYGSSVDR